MRCVLRRTSCAVRRPIGGALYGVGGFAVPYVTGGAALLCVYAAIRFSLAREASVTGTPQNRSLAAIFAQWRVAAMLHFYFVLFADLTSIKANLQIWLGARPYNEAVVNTKYLDEHLPQAVNAQL